MLLLVVGAEIFLRVKFGFCDSPLCLASDEYEYICQPSQQRHRFGNYVAYNSYSQRSDEPDSSRVIILGLGDSVINGGVQTDQSELATTMATDSTLQILNISAGSWGPDNCAAYLRHYGTFGASKMLLVTSSHDAHDIMDFTPTVGVHKSFPDHQYRSAIVELFDRYLLPRVFKGGKKELDPDQKVLAEAGTIVKGTGKLNPGFDQLKAIADSAGIELEIYLHPERGELASGRFNEQGEEIIEWARSRGVKLTSGFDAGETDATFRDGIHLNPEGQKILAGWMQRSTASLQ